MKLWMIPVAGSVAFFLIAVAAGHVWTTALLRTAVSAVVLAVVAVAVEGVRRWVAEAASSTIDLRSEPEDEDLAQIAVARPSSGSETPDPLRAEAEEQSSPSVSPMRAPSPQAEGPKDGQWTDLAAWVQRRR